MNHHDYNGILNDLTSGLWKNPITNKISSIPINKIEILPTLDGLEYKYIQHTHPNENILLISDEITHEVLGKRIFNNLSKKIKVKEYVWKNPKSSIEGVKFIQNISKNYSVLIAIGSGSINDTVKYVTFLDNKKYSVFPTSPMNAYTSPSASISFDGIKKSISAHPPKGVYFDLSILTKCPHRLIASAFSDVICRTTAQVDWLLSKNIQHSHYDETPYYLLNQYEDDLISSAKNLKKGNIDAIALLTRVAAIMGLSTFFIGSTHYGSMAEHGISHFIDMFAKKSHSGTFHGEQVGISTLTISKIQNLIFNQLSPPVVYPTKIPYEKIESFLGTKALNLVNQQMKNKIIDSKKADKINHFLDNNWANFTKQISRVMIKYENLWDAMSLCGSLRTNLEANIDQKFYNNAIRYSRFIRDRYTILDFAGDSNQLENYID